MSAKKPLLLALVLLGLCTALIAVLASGCTGGAPARKPAIPRAISQGPNQEPTLNVYVKETGQVKKMKLEDYVAGTVAGEIDNFFPEEALAAQAILARTYVLNFIATKGHSKYPGAHISTDPTEAQAWNQANVNDRIRRAVTRTRGQVLVHNGRFIEAWFHSHAGGMTATAREGLNWKKAEPPYITVVKSPDSPAAPPERARWSTVLTKQEITAALAKIGAPNPGAFNTIEITERGPSGRATRLRIGNATVPAAEFRVAIGPNKMKSTKITSIRPAAGGVRIAGLGFGHGVGMSQWGAYQLAKDGRKARDILNFYFRNVDIVKMWR
ncbi:MAG: SpoIID/LytB domain-containing protein [Bacillota bacterium]|nr:SpoIID/LytB domain-containing protein [Bacillota bacterium]